MTIVHGQQENFGKAVLAIASVKAKEMHENLIFIFGVHHICFYPDPKNKMRKKPFQIKTISLFGQ